MYLILCERCDRLNGVFQVLYYNETGILDDASLCQNLT